MIRFLDPPAVGFLDSAVEFRDSDVTAVRYLDSVVRF